MPPSESSSKVVCTCRSCRQEQVKIHGRLQPGQFVSAATRSRHRKKDDENHRITTAKQVTNSYYFSYSMSDILLVCYSGTSRSGACIGC
jgi:hypothetical protein